MNRDTVETAEAPEAIGPYSQGVVWERILFCSGQIPLDPETGKLVEGSITSQVDRVLKNLRAVLEAGGSGIKMILRLDVFLTDLSLFPEVNAILAEVFDKDPPARVTVQVSALPMGAQVEMAAIAAVAGNPG